MVSTAFIGFGEAAAAFVGNLPSEALQQASGFDIKSNTDRAAMATRFSALGVQHCETAQHAVQKADVVLSLVTADQAEAAAQSATGMKQNGLYLDGNSCSPGTKRKNEAIITQAGGCYVDLAIMAPVHPNLKNVSLLVCGEHAVRASEFLRGMGLKPHIVEGETGSAASIKMIRSIAIKGLEAVLAECTLAGVRAGVDAQVFASLESSFPGFGWADRSGYMLERMLTHGVRRAAEMQEVSKTVAELGMPNHMSCAAVSWHDRLGAAEIDIQSTDYRELADQVIGTIGEQ